MQWLIWIDHLIIMGLGPDQIDGPLAFMILELFGLEIVISL